MAEDHLCRRTPAEVHAVFVDVADFHSQHRFVYQDPGALVKISFMSMLLLERIGIER
ncbi:MAG: hypothetical protein GY822_19740 [Deltaproteobacteria bacterium]|nr:hypothetical protein [Deltaproteobacteria bacterium]